MVFSPGLPGDKKTSARGKSPGFSIVELSLCVWILALALIFVIALFSKMLSAATKGGDLTAAAYLGSAEMDKLVYNPSYLHNLVIQTGHTNSFLYTVSGQSTQALNNIVFNISDTASPYVPDFTSTTGCAAPCLYLVDVEVDWWGKTNSAKVGYGKLSIHLHRLIYDGQ